MPVDVVPSTVHTWRARPDPASSEAASPVRYEDMIRDLGSQARRIGDWLDVDLDGEAVRADRDAYAHHITRASSDPSIGRWKADLSDTEIEILRERLSESARPFGYRTHVNHDKRPDRGRV